MNGKYHAYIIDDGGDFKVRPAVATVAPDGSGKTSFSIRNLTELTATVTFTTRDPVEENGRPARLVSREVPANSVAVIDLSRGASGWYPYRVTFGDALRSGGALRARGESDPGMIVDP